MKFRFFFMFLLSLLITGCGSSDIKLTKAISGTLTALPSKTLIPPAHTPIPSSTPESLPTITETPNPVPDPIVIIGNGNKFEIIDKWDGPAFLSASYIGRYDFDIYYYDQKPDSLNDSPTHYSTYHSSKYKGLALIEPVDFAKTEPTRFLWIQSNGHWEITIFPVSTKYSTEFDKQIDGTGNLIVSSPNLAGAKIAFDASRSTGHKALYSVSDSGYDLLLNRIGIIFEEITLPMNTKYLIIDTDDYWLLTIE